MADEHGGLLIRHAVERLETQYEVKVSRRVVALWAADGKIPGAYKDDMSAWRIPEQALPIVAKLRQRRPRS